MANPMRDEWLASLEGDEPLHLGAPICELVRQPAPGLGVSTITP